MNYLKAYIGFFLTSLFVFSTVGCQTASVSSAGDSIDGIDSDGETDTDNDINGDNVIEIAPSGPLVLGFFEKQEFVVTVKNDNAVPLAGAPVSASFVDPAHNGELSPFEFVTDAQGRGRVVLTAPDKELGFNIRFSSPTADDVLVFVDVNPDALDLVISITYEGERQIASLKAILFENATCDEIASLEDADAVEILELQSDEATFEFNGLRANSTYAVLALGLNNLGGKRAQVCTDKLTVQSPDPQLQISDIPLYLSGNFAVTTNIVTGGGADEMLDKYVSAIDWFTDDAPGAILDYVGFSLQDEALLQDFNNIREYWNLDLQLTQNFALRDVDVPAKVEEAQISSVSHLSTMTTYSTMVFRASSDGSHGFTHAIDEVEFFGCHQNLLFDEATETEGVAQINPQNMDQLLLNDHFVHLPFGTVAGFVFSKQIASTELQTVAEAIAEYVDCDAVAALLVPNLNQIATFEELSAACQAAAQAVEESLADERDELNTAYSTLSMDGDCILTDPGATEQVVELSQGQMSVEWIAAEPIGPFDATFIAEKIID